MQQKEDIYERWNNINYLDDYNNYICYIFDVLFG